MSDEPEQPRPFSWDAIAAEVAAGLEDDEALPAEGWDVVARQLAAGLGAPADLPAAADPAAAEEAATVEEAPALSFGRAPAAPPVELEVVPEPEAPVEEAAPDDAPVQEELALGLDADPAVLRGGLEALLFVVDAPVDEVTLADALRCPVPQVRRELAALAAGYDERRAGIVLRRVGEGWRLYTREEHAPVVERHLLGGQRNRLTQAALETLAVIAYRQPVTRARVSAIRGVGVDAVVRTLTSRGLIREAGSDPDTGGGLYVTTPLFLERLGLTGLDELPELAPLMPDAGSLLDEHPDA
ncbi:Segregation and condensation protein B [Modestobacter italicus]|uniref:Segregation and condensation protein B n=1 Tax=Modestobacter italicus (strain DSM 44449 / CECT 9708 / BC 501) TaxID=2732864 RepID=I4EYW9_MODI5|nr:SMC-Scp complex subunit ScpB [Modestobacter marinus]CCH88582.1 Segregation and condensation protein B [Modestobacter marinus]